MISGTERNYYAIKTERKARNVPEGSALSSYFMTFESLHEQHQHHDPPSIWDLWSAPLCLVEMSRGICVGPRVLRLAEVSGLVPVTSGSLDSHLISQCEFGGRRPGHGPLVDRVGEVWHRES